MTIRSTTLKRINSSLIITIVYLLSLFQHANCGFSNWQSSGGVAWSFGCDFFGQDLDNIQSSGELCGPCCVQTSSCTHFTWTNYNGGTC
ncbi:hypothetical protein I4U23_022441 [Adineta vaga]|nr:hypothetical protein I4U23_022441 [Adineta vaga]